MDDCRNCYYKIYCQSSIKFFPGINPCSLVLPDDKNLMKQIDDITEDLHAQYD